MASKRTYSYLIIGCSLFLAGCSPTPECGEPKVTEGIKDLLSKNSKNVAYQELRKTGKISLVEEFTDQEVLLSNQYDAMRKHFDDQAQGALQKYQTSYGYRPCHQRLLPNFPDKIVAMFYNETSRVPSTEHKNLTIRQICDPTLTGWEPPVKFLNNLRGLDPEAQKWRAGVMPYLRELELSYQDLVRANKAFYKSQKVKNTALGSNELFEAIMQKWEEAHKYASYQISDIRMQTKNETTRAILCKATVTAKVENSSANAPITYMVEVTADKNYYLSILGGVSQ